MKNIKTRQNSKQRKRMKNKLFSLLFLSLGILLSIGFISAASDQYRPYLHKPSVGQYPKLATFGNYQTQPFPGSASYSYELTVSPGTNSLSPRVIVSYNSQSVFQNPSLLGAGWTITQNYILRNINFTVNTTSDDSFVLYLNGYSDKLVYRSGAYKTFIDTYLKIENQTSGSNLYWIVTSTDGTKYTFGLKSTSALQSNSSNYTVKWFLDSIEDTHGNTINYSYVKNPYSGDVGAVYSSNITYNRDQLRRVTFRYENATRPDKRLVYEQGSKFLETRRLTGVDMYFNNSLVRRYDFTFTDLNTEKTMSSLSNITYFGADNSSILNVVSFEYYDAQPGFENSSNWLVPEEFTSLDSGLQDFGSRLVDVNNDGFVDFVKSNSTSNLTMLNDKNSTWNSTTLFSVPEQIVDSSNKYQGVTFIDVNKDGLVDLLKSKGGATRKVYLNNGTAWRNVTNTTWVIPADFVNSSSDDEGVRFLDLNGDGLIDIVQGKASGSIKSSWINNGSTWINTSLWVLPDYFVGTGGNDTGLREIDLNGDGLTDLLMGGQTGSAWLNNGTGWVNETSYAPNIQFTNSTYPDLGVRFMDINGDVLTDILQNYFSNVSYLNLTCYNLTNSTPNCTLYNVTNLTNVKINNGSGWVFSATWQSPESFTTNGFNTGRRIADVNGDGYSDIVVGFKNGTVQKKSLVRNATSSFVLKKVKHEYGGVTSILYNKSTLSDNGQNLGFNIWLATNITANNSLNGSFGVIGSTSYRYIGGKFDYPNSEFLGFSNVNETSPDGSVTSHFFYQDSVLKGKEYATIDYDSRNNRIKQLVNRYTNSSDNKVYLNSTSELNYEGNPTPVIANITYTYDSYGNVAFVNYSGNVASSGDEKYETYSYIYNTTAYIVNKPSNYSLQNSSLSILKRTWFYYDNLTSGTTKGDLTRTVKYNDRGSNPETNYSYDSYGNVIRQTDALGNEINYTVESTTNTFVVKQTNALGHVVNYNYDRGTGNILFEEKDGTSKNYTYDTFGRNTKEFTTPDNITLPTKRVTYDFDGNSPERVVVETKNNDSDYSESMYFYDGFANPVQVKLEYSSVTQIVQSYLYDTNFRIWEDEVPYFQAYSTQMNTSASGFNMKYGYDAMDRVINVTKRDNSTIQTVFNNTKVTSVNELGIRKEYFIDTYGRITNISEHNRDSSGSDQVYNTSYYYDSSDNLIKVVDAQGNNFTFEYDSLGRKTSMDDPNMERWTYSYDSNGNLINQTDGRNITTFLTYDKLNRLTFKIAGSSNITLVYDGQLNGTLTNVTSDDTYYSYVRIKYAYDTRRRVAREDTQVYNYEAGTEVGSRSEWLNISLDYDSQDRILDKYMPNVNLTNKYNSLGKLEQVQGFLTSVNYNAFGKANNKTYNNGLISTYGYDNLSRINQISMGSVQNLSYSYDAAGNVKLINDTNNNLVYNMTYDDLDRLVRTVIYNYNTFEHEKFVFMYNKISGLISKITDSLEMNSTYTSLAHAPTSISMSNRSTASINLSLVDPSSQKNVTRNTFFNFTLQACCLNNDCWGINVSLDPDEDSLDNITYEETSTLLDTNDSFVGSVEDKTSIGETEISPVIAPSSIKHSYSPNSEITCIGGMCNAIYYSETKFTYENGTWKDIRDAHSLKSVWGIAIDEDLNFPLIVIDYNYTSITLNLSVSDKKIGQIMPLRIYDRNNNSLMPQDAQGNSVNKDKTFKFNDVNENQIVTIDLSDTVDNLLTQEIKWGDASTIVTVYDNNSVNTDDAYIRDSSYASQNYGSDPYLYLRNSTTSNEEFLIRFNTSQIPRQALVDEARIYLYLESNGLTAGKIYNVSVHSIYPAFIWNESTIKWNIKPQIGTDYNDSYMDKVSINNTEVAKYLSWNVTEAIRNKRGNESFYFKAIENYGGVSTNDIRFRSKDQASTRPYLNVTYRLKNLVSTTTGETPFYTTNANPRYIDLEQNQCQNITWTVNATGSLGNYIFFGYANKTANRTIGALSGFVDVTIV